MMFRLLLLVVILEVSETEQNNYEISRGKYDVFKLPSFLCSDWKSNCVAMGGVKMSRNCKCKCSEGNANVYGYFDNSWKCTSNHDVRRNYSECSVERFDGSNENSPLKVVNTQVSDTEVLIAETTLKNYDCTLESMILYLDCNGKWKTFTVGTSNDAFKLDTDPPQYLYHKGKHFGVYDPAIYGRIVKLTISCTGTNNQNDQRTLCLLLKVKGKQNCKADLPTTSPTTTSTTSTQISSPTTSSTTSSTTSTTTTTLVSPTTSSTSIPTTFHPNEQTSAASITAAEKITVSSPKEITHSKISTTGRVKTNSTNSPQKIGGSGANTSGSSGGAIGGAVGGVAALVTIVVILLVTIRKRKRHSQASKRESAAPIADNPSYHNTMPIDDHLGFQDDEYSYAYTNNHPIVIKDQNGRVVTGPGVANGHTRNIDGVSGSPPHNEAPVYSTLEDPNYAKLSSGPYSYNVLVRPENQWITKQGPVYDVLENPNFALNTSPNTDGPIYNTLEDPNSDEPSYDVLEDPNSTGAPVYSVLEGPNSNEQRVYDTLEGQDPHVYGSLDSPDPHLYGALYSPTSKVVPQYDHNIYDSTEGIINEDTYQELNHDGQRSADLYQPIRPKRKAMVMKNMSENTQSQA